MRGEVVLLTVRALVAMERRSCELIKSSLRLNYSSELVYIHAELIPILPVSAE
jgi:hypothetical protein